MSVQQDTKVIIFISQLEVLGCARLSISEKIHLGLMRRSNVWRVSFLQK
jgi:hypothetical protein